MKTIVITGANRGIGLELVKTFSADSIVYAVCRSEFPNADLNDHIKVIRLDITDEQAIKDFAKRLEDEGVALDLLINNAGIAGGDEAKNVKTDFNSVIEVFTTNIISPMIMSLHLAPLLKKSNRPVMIAISSRMGTHAMLDEYNAEWWPYSSSKAALSLAVSSFAINEPSIKSISVHPGWVKTRMGGDDADIEPTTSADGIRKLYDKIDSLKTGKMYNYDGALMAW